MMIPLLLVTPGALPDPLLDLLALPMSPGWGGPTCKTILMQASAERIVAC
jgi:hypothetical protein